MTLEHDIDIFISDAARDVVLNFRARSDRPDKDDLAMWIEVTGISGTGFSYDMYLKGSQDAGPSDAVVGVADGLNVVVPVGSTDQLNGATIDYRSAPDGGGLFVDNPNTPSPVAGPTAHDAPTPQLSGEVADQVAQILEQQINPFPNSRRAQARAGWPSPRTEGMPNSSPSRTAPPTCASAAAARAAAWRR